MNLRYSFELSPLSKNSKLICYKYRLTYSDKYEISSKANLEVIDKTINEMNLVDKDSINSSLLYGDFIIIEVHKKDLIESYRVQGSLVTKEIFKNTYDNYVETSYYYLDIKYYHLLEDLFDKLKKESTD